MPSVGDRKVKGGVLGEWNGSTWVLVAEPGTRKTKGNVTAEWDGATWQQVEGEREPAQQDHTAGMVAGVSGLAGGASRAMVQRLGEQVATSPNLGRVVGLVAKPVASKVVSSAVGGMIGGVPGAIAGAALPTAALARGGARLAEAGIRGSARAAARVAGSNVARVIAGPGALLASMPVSEAGDRPTGETPERTSQRQATFAEQFRDDVNRQAGREVITGTTTEEIIASIARYRSQR